MVCGSVKCMKLKHKLWVESGARCLDGRVRGALNRASLLPDL
jgi:hypothetical protein